MVQLRHECPDLALARLFLDPSKEDLVKNPSSTFYGEMLEIFFIFYVKLEWYLTYNMVDSQKKVNLNL